MNARERTDSIVLGMVGVGMVILVALLIVARLA